MGCKFSDAFKLLTDFLKGNEVKKLFRRTDSNKFILTFTQNYDFGLTTLIELPFV